MCNCFCMWLSQESQAGLLDFWQSQRLSEMTILLANSGKPRPGALKNLGPIRRYVQTDWVRYSGKHYEFWAPSCCSLKGDPSESIQPSGQAWLSRYSWVHAVKYGTTQSSKTGTRKQQEAARHVGWHGCSSACKRPYSSLRSLRFAAASCRSHQMERNTMA